MKEITLNFRIPKDPTYELPKKLLETTPMKVKEIIVPFNSFCDVSAGIIIGHIADNMQNVFDVWEIVE